MGLVGTQQHHLPRADRVQSGAFGACLMREPRLVGECLAAMAEAVDVPVIVSGDRTVWSSTDCPADPVERTLLIDAGGSASASLTWNGASAAASCSGAAPSPPPSSAPPPEATTPAPRDTATAEDGASPSASPTPTPTPLDPNAAGAGTYRFRLRLDGVDLTGEQTFIVT